jgi:hypothetical protein
VWSGTLAELPGAVTGRPTDAPGTLVIGDVVRVGAILGAEMNQSAGEAASAHEALGVAAMR